MFRFSTELLSTLDAVLTDFVTGGERRYRITRAYHGIDDDNGELITDLTLREPEA